MFTANVTVPRELGIQAGNENVKEKESLTANHEETEEAEIDDGLRISQVQPNIRKWNRQTRELNTGGTKIRLGAQKRPIGETIKQSPKQKKIKFTSPIKSETKKHLHFSPTARLKLSWKPLVLEDMEVIDSNIAAISIKAGSQPCRKL